MKKNSVVSLVFLVCSMLFARDWFVDIEPEFGYKQGDFKEFVFNDISVFSTDKTSELEWYDIPELSAGVKVSGGWKGAFLQSEVLFGFPLKEGILFDRDWINVLNPAASIYQYQTNYSESPVKLDTDFSVSAKTGYKFDFFEMFSVAPFVGYEFDYFSWTCYGGTYKYGLSYNGIYASYQDVLHRRVGSFGNYKLMNYELISHFLWLGADFVVKLLCKVSITSGLAVSPFSYTYAFDRHFLKDTKYYDESKEFFHGLKGNAGVQYEINPKNSIALSVSGFLLRETRGDYYLANSVSDSSYIKIEDYSGGAYFAIFNASLSWKVKLF